MGADNNIDFASGKIINGLLLLFGSAETRNFGDFDWPGRESVTEILVVLLCQ